LDFILDRLATRQDRRRLMTATPASACNERMAIGDRPPRAQPRWATLAAVLLVLAVYAALAIGSAFQRSVGVDELFHVTAGFFYDTTADYRLQPENGILPQRLEGLPAALLKARPPILQGNAYWATSDMQVVGYQFFYESGNDHWPLLMAARIANLLFAIGLLVFVFSWARRVGGAGAGLVAVTLAAFSPTLLAHGPMATSDTAAGLLLLCSVSAFWWQLRQPAVWRAVVSGAVFGLACVAKFSAVLLPVVFALLLIWHFATVPAAARRFRFVGASIAGHVLIAWAVIWAFYGFRYSAFSPHVPPAQQFAMPWDWVLGRIGWQAGPIRWLRDSRLLPEAYLYGYTFTYHGALRRSAFLAGQLSTTGWREFFPLAFWWKSTPAEIAGLIACLLAAALRWPRLKTWSLRLAPLLALALVYGLSAITSHLNIGHRHLLPLYPVLFIAVGVAITRWRRRGLVIGAALCLAQVVSAARILPYPVAYFNALAGGPANGWRLLVDSSLDWGQDLPGLRRWLEANNSGPNAQPVFLSYFGSGEPNYYKIRATRMIFLNGFQFPVGYYSPQAGVYCISATMLQEVYSPVRGPWTPQREREYQELRALEPQFREYLEHPAARSQLLAAAPAERWETGWQRFALLQHARLCAYLRARGPDAEVGYSILIFRLSDAEVQAALLSSYGRWLTAVEQAAGGRRP
jgi:4-amino-4-deoxy-L-arabinose transferase-like glycosyltransferase